MLHFAELSQHERVDTSTSNGRLVSGIFASIAEFEGELIRDRVRSGLAAARARGHRLGRPKVSVNVAEVARLRAQGLSWRAISREIGLGEGTVRRSAQGWRLLRPGGSAWEGRVSPWTPPG